MSVELDVTDSTYNEYFRSSEERSKGSLCDAKLNLLANSHFSSIHSISPVKCSDLNSGPFGVSGEIEINISFGDNVEVSGGGSVRGSDSDGNYVEVEGKVKDDGSGNVSVRAGRDDDKD